MRRLWQGLRNAVRRVLDIPIGLQRTDDPLKTLYHQQMPPRLGWNWFALILGPFWYLAMGMWVYGFLLLSIAFLSGGLLLPFVWLYAGLKANEDLLDFRIARRSFY